MILVVDPGTQKAGYALADSEGRLLERGILSPGDLLVFAAEYKGKLTRLIVGAGTGHKPLAQGLAEASGIAVTLVDERETTLLARKRYFVENPPKGWRRLLPVSLQTPPGPIDDYVAVLLLERYLAQHPSANR